MGCCAAVEKTKIHGRFVQRNASAIGADIGPGAILSIEGEIVRKLKPVSGHLHRSHEEMAESASYFGSMPYTDQLDYFCSTTNNVHTKSSTSLHGRSKDFADYVSRRSNACPVVLRSASVLDVRRKRRLARSPIQTGTPNQSRRVR
jgi:hypothetical protein